MQKTLGKMINYKLPCSMHVEDLCKRLVLKYMDW